MFILTNLIAKCFCKQYALVIHQKNTKVELPLHSGVLDTRTFEGSMKLYSYDEIYKRMKIVAKIISLYGEEYLPIFERLQIELEKAAQRKKILDLANEFAVE